MKKKTGTRGNVKKTKKKMIIAMRKGEIFLRKKQACSPIAFFLERGGILFSIR